MTIKPTNTVASAQNRASTDAENEAPEADQAAAQQQQQQHVSRTAAAHQHRNVVIDGHGQSPQHMAEVFDEVPRHRCNTHKNSNTRNKRRDPFEHAMKRDRNEREKLSNISPNAAKGNVTHAAATAIAVASGGVANNNNIVSALQASASGGGVSSNTVDSNTLPCMSSGKLSATITSAQNIPKTGTNLLTVAQTTEENYSGYNSGDEHLHPKEAAIAPDEWQRRDEQFAKCMTDRGYVLKPVEEDGACLFRAISLQIYGDEGMHDVIRQHTMDYIFKNREYFGHFVTEDINNYIKRKRRTDSHGNHIEIQAMSEIYNRPVEVYCYKSTPINIFNSEQLANGYAPLRLSYQRGSHYNAIIDPYNATVGVGLGLAGYQPELQTKEATRLSEQLEIEQTMFEDKLKTTDWEATNEAIEEQIARESYLQWCRETAQRQRPPPTSTAVTSTITSSAANSGSSNDGSPSKYLDQSISSNSAVCNTPSAAVSAIASSNDEEPNANVPGNSGFCMSTASAASVLMQLKQKEVKDIGFESDDTDISSTSSVGNTGNNSPSSRSRKKSRIAANKNGKKRRKEPSAQNEEKNEDDDDDTPRASCVKEDTTEVSLPTITAENLSILDAEQQPCTSKQLQAEKAPPTTGHDLAHASTSSSVAEKTESNLYQELLQASYADFNQLTESEMLQQAIQMSTQDYMEDLKRKY